MKNVDDIRNWIRGLPAGDERTSFEETWDAFAQTSRPVVTVFGSYDSGKSSLIRRLLVDAGQPVPEWLTISARHETFENNTAEYGDCLLRDTPGFAVGATDGRGESNTAHAMEAVALTDVAIAVLTPQLVTSDRDLFQTLLDRDWPTGSLWFVISRFDEAGADPEGDLPGYEELRTQKKAELRELFDLDPQVPVFVVAQDPFQEAGPDSVLPVVWDQYRSWDGMQELTDRLRQLSTASLDQVRGPAATRYWSQAAVGALKSLHEDLALCEANSRVATQGATRRTVWESELGVIDNSARSSLDGLVESVVDQWLGAPGTTIRQVQAEIERSLSRWFTEHDAHLQRLERSISKSVERDHRQPAWSTFTSLVTGLANAAPAAPVTPGNPAMGKQVSEVGKHLIKVMRALDKAGVGTGKKMTEGGKILANSKGDQGLGKYIPAVEAALPIAILIADQIDQQRTKNAAAQGQTATTITRQTVIDACTDQTIEAWAGLIQNTRNLIERETEDQVRYEVGLRDAVVKLEVAISTGESLLRHP